MGKFALIKAAKDEDVLISQLAEGLEGVYGRLRHAMCVD